MTTIVLIIFSLQLRIHNEYKQIETCVSCRLGQYRHILLKNNNNNELFINIIFMYTFEFKTKKK